MATWDDVTRLALALPGAEQGTAMGTPLAFRVGGRLFVWRRPLGKRDRAALGEAVPPEDPLGVRVEHLLAREVLIQDNPDVFFTIPHFDDYPAVLVRIEPIDLELLEEVITEAWLCRAPKTLVRDWEAERS